jgi:tetratricopeptide (TPR) repeat protein
MQSDLAAFHRETAQRMAELYGASDSAPEGWRETLAWHWERAGAFPEAADAALEVAESRVTQLDFAEARIWAERVLSLLDRLDGAARHTYELRAYALTMAVLEFAGQYREGLGYARLLLRLAEERRVPEMRARAHLAIGRLQREVGQLAAGEAELLRSLSIAEQAEHEELVSEARLQLAKVHQLQGRHLEALQQLQIAQDALPADDLGRLARVCTGLGDVYRVLGAGREALRFYNRALKLEMSGGNPLGQAMLYEKLGLAQLDASNLGEALACLHESLQLRAGLDDRVGQARANSILGLIQSRLGDHAAALEHFAQARAFEERLQNRRGMAIALTNSGDAARASGDAARAAQSYGEALALAREANDQVAVARLRQRQGDLLYSQGNPVEARDAWGEALSIRRALGHSEEAIALENRLASGLPGRLRHHRGEA